MNGNISLLDGSISKTNVQVFITARLAVSGTVLIQATAVNVLPDGEIPQAAWLGFENQYIDAATQINVSV